MSNNTIRFVEFDNSLINISLIAHITPNPQKDGQYVVAFSGAIPIYCDKDEAMYLWKLLSDEKSWRDE